MQSRILLTIAFVLFTMSALQAQTEHWVLVSSLTEPSAVTIYLDDANIISEDGYMGYKIRTVYADSFDATDASGTNFQLRARIAVFEINCSTNAGRGKRVADEDINGISHPNDMIWRTIDKPPASVTLAIVKARVCK
jgi:hypothetical protein